LTEASCHGGEVCATAQKKPSYLSEFTKGIIRQNPIFGLVLGLCPTLAVTTSVENGVGMGIATIFVLVGSCFMISLLRKNIPSQIRIPIFILIIATFVTVTDLVMTAYTPALSKSLGIFVPLIVVNCIVFGRVEAFSSKQPVLNSVLDAAGMGAGFTLALILLGGVRELLGTGSIVFAGRVLLSLPIAGASAMLIASGAYLTLGLVLGASRRIGRLLK
jgi:electron transport complex protein RnfE